jgi:N utilization substance protein A
VRAYVVKVQKKGQKVLIMLSRTHPNLVKELFTVEVPEIGDRIVEIKGIVREPGHRTKIAVYSSDLKVDPIGACVGVRGSRIRNIVEELNGEKIDIVRWHDSQDLFIRNALSPAEISSVEIDRENQRARVIVPEDQLSLAIGKKGQNVRLTAKLTHWHIDIMTEEQAKKIRDAERAEIYKIPNLPQGVVEKFLLAGLNSLHSLQLKGGDFLSTMYGITLEQAAELMAYCDQREAEIVKEKEHEKTQAAAPAAAVAVPAGEAVATEAPAGEAPVVPETTEAPVVPETTETTEATSETATATATEPVAEAGQDGTK